MAVVVKAKKDESNDSLFRRFKKEVLKYQILLEVRKREYHKKPSVLKKERIKEAKRKRYLENKHR